MEGLRLAFADTTVEGSSMSEILLSFVHKERLCLLPNQRLLELPEQVPRFSLALMRVLYGEQYNLRGGKYPTWCVTCGIPPGKGRTVF